MKNDFQAVRFEDIKSNKSISPGFGEFGERLIINNLRTIRGKIL